MSLSSQPAFVAHANVFHHDSKPVPIELFIVTIPRDGSDSKVICIMVNHARLTSTPKYLQSNSYANARLRPIHHPLPKSVAVEYLPFCVRGKFSLLARGNRALKVVKGTDQQKYFKSWDCLSCPWRCCLNSKTFTTEPLPTPCTTNLQNTCSSLTSCMRNGATKFQL
ncbi:hypothetical protein TNCV_2277861 [Trichonephila clavipes]|nr:hypothetical protein TNCV_2277861 [Trichonephila clavipes]